MGTEQREAAKERTVPISRLHAVETQVLKQMEMIQSMANVLKIGVESGAMPEDWITQAQSLIDRA